MIKRLERGLLLTNQIVLAVFMTIMFIFVFANVVTRYIFNFSINWAEEISRYLMIWVAYLGMGLAMREARHVAIELLQDRLPKVGRRLLRAVVGVILILFMAVLTVLGFRYAVFALDHETAALQWSMGLIYLTIPIGAILFLLYMVTTWREYIERPPMTDQPADETPPEGEGA